MGLSCAACQACAESENKTQKAPAFNWSGESFIRTSDQLLVPNNTQGGTGELLCHQQDIMVLLI